MLPSDRMLVPSASRAVFVALLGTFIAAPACLVSIPELADDPAESGNDAGAGEAGLEADVASPEADVAAETEADVPGCEAGTVDCDGSCVQLSDNKLHCGQCGHDCLGGECFEGVCQPVLLASGIQKPYGLVKDSSFIYGTSDDAAGKLWKVSVDGCPTPAICASLISTTGTRYQDIAIDTDALYFTDKSADRVIRIEKTGQNECTLASSQQTPVGIAVDDEYVYWGAQTGDEIWRASKSCGAGTPPEVFVASTPSPQLVRLDSTGLYWTSLDGGQVSWASLDGTSTEPVWSGTTPGDFMFGLAMDDQWVYWRDGHQFPDSGTGRVARAPKDRSGGLEVLAEDQENPRYLAVDDTHVYWTSDGAVRRTAKAGTGGVETLAEGFPSAHGILVDGPAVYFCTYSGGELYKVAK